MRKGRTSRAKKVPRVPAPLLRGVAPEPVLALPEPGAGEHVLALPEPGAGERRDDEGEVGKTHVRRNRIVQHHDDPTTREIKVR